MSLSDECETDARLLFGVVALAAVGLAVADAAAYLSLRSFQLDQVTRRSTPAMASWWAGMSRRRSCPGS